jgi:hypothetical protein
MCLASLCLFLTHTHTYNASFFLNDARNLFRLWLLLLSSFSFVVRFDYYFLFHSLIATVKKKRKEGVDNCSIYIYICVCSDDEDCLIINFFYALQPLHIFDDVWNGTRFIRWGLKTEKYIKRNYWPSHLKTIFLFNVYIYKR